MLIFIIVVVGIFILGLYSLSSSSNGITHNDDGDYDGYYYMDSLDRGED